MPGYAVTVTEKGDEWSKISSNGVEGYIKNEYLVFGEEAKAHYRNMCGITGVVQADSFVSVRQHPQIPRRLEH